MCLAVIAVDVHPRFSVVVAANRDEFHARAAAPAHWWRDTGGVELLAGRDLRLGGTWLGVTPHGRWAFVTNVREPGRHDPRAPSRGALVPAVLHDAHDVVDAVARAVLRSRAHNGFNLVAGEGTRAAFGSNRMPGTRSIGAGIHGVSNAGLDTPWPKLVRAKSGLAAWIDGGTDATDSLFDVLADRAFASDDELPATGLSRERERLLSSPFIVSADYGTRCSTVLTVAHDGGVGFVERSFDAAGNASGEIRFSFRAASPRRPAA